MARLPRFLTFVTIAMGSFVFLKPCVAGGETVVFDRDIQPIFSDNCYQCHGPDEKARKAKLRLDTKEGAFRIRNGKTVITAGKSAESEMIRRITSNDPDEQMPPPES